mmetsp:Transcript_16173/g.17951  ORF Transcript_16173/g.17951 Transcript_16173/m.17951 type:complete len:114 (-) Transcript_16173:70-411(-)
MIYVWSKANHNQIIHFMMLFRIRAGYLPYLYLLISIIARGEIAFDLVGIIIGHLFFYAYFIVPNLPFTRGINILAAPRFVKYIITALQLDSQRELVLEEGDFVDDDAQIPFIM